MVKEQKPRLSPGEIVAGRYRIDGVVGRGGFGAVYRATQLATGVSVALKVLLKNFSTAQKDYKRFQREAAMVQKLQHPNVVALLDYGQTEKGAPYIAFELLEGTALRSILKEQGALPLERVVEVTRDILCALEAAHALGIIHRDVKPGNIMLCTNGVTKVLDFGIAKAVDGEEANATQLTEAGQMIGTPQYMAPEQVRGLGVMPASDLYALGLLTAEMLSGERVVKGSALIDVYMQHISDQPLMLSSIVMSSPLGPILSRATAKVIEQRYASAREMLTDLASAFPGLRIPSSDTTTEMRILADPDDPMGATHNLLEETVDDVSVPHSSTMVLGPGQLRQLVPRGVPASGAPASGAPASGTPASGTPASGAPASGAPASGAPASGAPASGPSSLAPESLGATVAMPRDAGALGEVMRQAAANRKTSDPPWSSSDPRSLSSAAPSFPTPSAAPSHPAPVPQHSAPGRGYTQPLDMYSSSIRPAHASAPGGFDIEVPETVDEEPASGGAGWTLVVIALLLAGVGIGVYLWAPWQDARLRDRGAPHASTPAAVPIVGNRLPFTRKAITTSARS